MASGSNPVVRNAEKCSTLRWEPFATVPKCNVEDTKAAIDAAREAFDKGRSGKTAMERSDIKLKLAQVVEKQKEKLVVPETRHM
jgi:acyl-CoA reductase-like NAD-dependent aldehyde dehydrogenase